MIFSDSLQARSLADSDCSSFEQEDMQGHFQVEQSQKKSVVMPTIEESVSVR